MNLITSEVFYHLLLTTIFLLPVSFFRYIPFQNKFRFSTKGTIILYFSFFITCNIILTYTGRFNSFFIANRSRAVLYFMMTLFSFLLIKDHIGKQLYVICFYANFSFLFSAVPLIPEALVYGKTSINLPFKILITSIVILISMPIIYHFCFKPLTTIVQRDIPKIWNVLWIVGLIQLALNATLSIPYQINDDLFGKNVIIRYSISIGSILLNQTLLYLINGMLNANDEKLALIAEKQQLMIQEYQYRNIQEQIEQSRRFRHDFKHHSSLISSITNDINLTEHDKLKKLTDYCNEYFCTIPSAEEIHFSDHYSLNLILNYYYNTANNAGIRTNFIADIPASIPMKDTELCVVVGNLLLNAIEGASTAPETLKQISLNVTKSNRNLLIVVENGFNGQINRTGDYFHSTKHESPGIGISNIKNIATHYNGNCYFENNDKIFSVKIHLILKY